MIPQYPPHLYSILKRDLEQWSKSSELSKLDTLMWLEHTVDTGSSTQRCYSPWPLPNHTTSHPPGNQQCVQPSKQYNQNMQNQIELLALLHSALAFEKRQIDSAGTIPRSIWIIHDSQDANLLTCDRLESLVVRIQNMLLPFMDGELRKDSETLSLQTSLVTRLPLSSVPPTPQKKSRPRAPITPNNSPRISPHKTSTALTQAQRVLEKRIEDTMEKQAFFLDPEIEVFPTHIQSTQMRRDISSPIGLRKMAHSNLSKKTT